ncbi:AbrB family transcriptional regulator [Rhodosalinus sp. FB01]|uniref:AbrB family transcriptional regulator n=1 Tax=Rhodosalinus sp. FB01 TaxID=3239194 RepID=UPI0035266173
MPLQHLPSVLFTVALGLAGGLVASFLGLPLPFMLGSLGLTAIVSLAGVKIGGQPPKIPSRARNAMIPIIGIMIGAKVTPDILDQMAQWWPSLLSVIPFVIIVQLMNYNVLRRLGGYDQATAFFAANPGGVAESLLVGEANGGNPALMTIQHFARVTLCVILVPVILSIALGTSVGSAAGTTSEPTYRIPGLHEVLMLGIGGYLGVLVARRLKLPAALLLGPFVVSAALHATGVTTAQVPDLLVNLALVVIGTNLGTKFYGQAPKTLLGGFGLSFVALFNALVLATLIALTIAALQEVSRTVVFVSFAPGGLVEMGLIAISLGSDPVFVAVHHLVRIMVAVIISPLIFQWLILARES